MNNERSLYNEISKLSRSYKRKLIKHKLIGHYMFGESVNGTDSQNVNLNGVLYTYNTVINSYDNQTVATWYYHNKYSSKMSRLISRDIRIAELPLSDLGLRPSYVYEVLRREYGQELITGAPNQYKGKSIVYKELTVDKFHELFGVYFTIYGKQLISGGGQNNVIISRDNIKIIIMGSNYYEIKFVDSNILSDYFIELNQCVASVSYDGNGTPTKTYDSKMIKQLGGNFYGSNPWEQDSYTFNLKTAIDGSTGTYMDSRYIDKCQLLINLYIKDANNKTYRAQVLPSQVTQDNNIFTIDFKTVFPDITPDDVTPSILSYACTVNVFDIPEVSSISTETIYDTLNKMSSDVVTGIVDKTDDITINDKTFMQNIVKYYPDAFDKLIMKDADKIQTRYRMTTCLIKDIKDTSHEVYDNGKLVYSLAFSVPIKHKSIMLFSNNRLVVPDKYIEKEGMATFYISLKKLLSKEKYYKIDNNIVIRNWAEENPILELTYPLDVIMLNTPFKENPIFNITPIYDIFPSATQMYRKSGDVYSTTSSFQVNTTYIRSGTVYYPVIRLGSGSTRVVDMYKYMLPHNRGLDENNFELVSAAISKSGYVDESGNHIESYYIEDISGDYLKNGDGTYSIDNGIRYKQVGRSDIVLKSDPDGIYVVDRVKRCITSPMFVYPTRYSYINGDYVEDVDGRYIHQGADVYISPMDDELSISYYPTTERFSSTKHSSELEYYFQDPAGIYVWNTDKLNEGFFVPSDPNKYDSLSRYSKATQSEVEEHEDFSLIDRFGLYSIEIDSAGNYLGRMKTINSGVYNIIFYTPKWYKVAASGTDNLYYIETENGLYERRRVNTPEGIKYEYYIPGMTGDDYIVGESRYTRIEKSFIELTEYSEYSTIKDYYPGRYVYDISTDTYTYDSTISAKKSSIPVYYVKLKYQLDTKLYAYFANGGYSKYDVESDELNNFLSYVVPYQLTVSDTELFAFLDGKLYNDFTIDLSIRKRLFGGNSILSFNSDDSDDNAIFSYYADNIYGLYIYDFTARRFKLPNRTDIYKDNKTEYEYRRYNPNYKVDCIVDEEGDEEPVDYLELRSADGTVRIYVKKSDYDDNPEQWGSDRLLYSANILHRKINATSSEYDYHVRSSYLETDGYMRQSDYRKYIFRFVRNCRNMYLTNAGCYLPYMKKSIYNEVADTWTDFITYSDGVFTVANTGAQYSQYVGSSNISSNFFFKALSNKYMMIFVNGQYVDDAHIAFVGLNKFVLLNIDDFNFLKDENGNNIIYDITIYALANVNYESAYDVVNDYAQIVTNSSTGAQYSIYPVNDFLWNEYSDTFTDAITSVNSKVSRNIALINRNVYSSNYSAKYETFGKYVLNKYDLDGMSDEAIIELNTYFPEIFDIDGRIVLELYQDNNRRRFIY